MRIKLRQQTLLESAPRGFVLARLAIMAEASGQMEAITWGGVRLVWRHMNSLKPLAESEASA